MYLAHFELQEKPFKISTDPRFLWLGEKHKEALATLLYGILYNDGYVVVTGDVGTGKTTLASALMTELGEKVLAVKVPFPDFDSLDFFKLIATAYGIGDGFQSKGSFFDLFGSFLRSSSSAGKKVVLIIDEAQRLTAEHLKELLHLSNIEENGARLLNVVFVGQNEFNDILLEEPNRALRQRITINYNLGTLTEEETAQYIAHRLFVAQGKKEIFPPEAIAEVFSFSGGIPRLINIVCDLALLMTYFEGEKIVRPETVKDCVQRLRLPNEKTAGGGKGAQPAIRKEEAVKIEIEGKDRDEGRAEREDEGGRKRFGVKAAYGAGFVFLILMVGSFFFFSKQEIPRQEEKPQEAKPEGDAKNSPVQKEMESVQEKGSPDLDPPTIKETASSVEMGKGSDPSPLQPEAKAPVESKLGKEPSAQGGKQKKRKRLVRRREPDSPGRLLPTLCRKKGDPRRKKGSWRIKKKRLPGSKGKRSARVPDSRPARPARNPQVKEPRKWIPTR